jgi:flavin reductase (DIM6/NTAB) family NADH-FMN oxidoreductase RutF
METNPDTLAPRLRHGLLTGLIVPRPIGWITTLGGAGRVNLAPFSFFNMVSSNPPTVIVSIGQRDGRPKDSLANLQAGSELVVNIVTRSLLEAMNATSIESPPDHDELRAAGLTAAPSAVVRPPRVAESPAHLEARVTQVVPVMRDDGSASNHVVFARVVHLHVADEVLIGEHKVDTLALAPVARLAGREYGLLGELIELDRPAWPAGAETA